MNKEDYGKYYIQGSDHYLIPKDVFDELFDEIEQLQQENQELKKEKYGKGDGVKMLKIRDGVDLKELEKYGFDLEQTKDEFDQIYGFDKGLLFYKDSKIIILPWNNQNTALDKLYDLIKDGLVEKVDDK